MIKLELDLPEDITLSSITWLRTMNKWSVYVVMPGARPGYSDPQGGSLHEDINVAAAKAIDGARYALLHHGQSAQLQVGDDLLKELGL